MDRRGFLKLFGAAVAGIALEQAVPLGRVWSFPKEIVLAQSMSVRFIKAYDPYLDRMLGRLDLLIGWPALAPKVGDVIELSRLSQLQPALDQMAEKHQIFTPTAELYESMMSSDPREPQHIGVDIDLQAIQAFRQARRPLPS